MRTFGGLGRFLGVDQNRYAKQILYGLRAANAIPDSVADERQ
jgi:hypothetical protein